MSRRGRALLDRHDARASPLRRAAQRHEARLAVEYSCTVAQVFTRTEATVVTGDREAAKKGALFVLVAIMRSG